MNNFFKTFFACLLAIIVSSALSFFFVILAFFGILAGMTSQPTHKTSSGSILHIDLSIPVVEKKSANPFLAMDITNLKFEKSQTLLDVVNLIDQAAKDPMISAILVDVPMAMPNSGGTLYELREALGSFKESSGKKVISYGDVYSQGGYFLASISDEIYLNPQGGLQWMGLSSQVMFYKGLFQKLGVEPEVFRCGKFKGAVEPFLLDKLSAENQLQLNSILSSVWGYYVSRISTSQQLDSANMQLWASDLTLTSPYKAKELGMITDLFYRDQLVGRLSEIASKESPDMVTMAQYATAKGAYMGPNPMSDNEVAVVMAIGEIVDQGADDQIDGNKLAETLSRLRRDDDVKAVVLRVNSPGGSALASEIIHREMSLLKAVKPVVVSMGDYAASGGYYISCNADRILAHETTLTGSIGVFGLTFNAAKGAKQHLGLTFDGVSTNTNSDMGGLFRPLTSAQRMFVQMGVDSVYSRFTNLVAQGRNMTVANVDSIAQGRVYSGLDAREIGLVDEFGTLRKAICVASQLAAVGADFYVVQYPKVDDSFSAMLSLALDASVAKLTPFAKEKAAFERLTSAQGVRAQMEYDLTIE